MAKSGIEKFADQVPNLFGKYSNIIVLAVAVVLVIIISSKITKALTQKARIDPDDLPNSGSGIPQGWTPSNMSDRLNDGISGINFLCWSSNGDMFKALAQLDTDDMFTAVYHDYNQRHAGRGDTLRTDVKGEVPCGWSPDADYWKNQALDRFARLNLS